MPPDVSPKGTQLGPIGTKVVFENEHIRVWSIELPGKGHASPVIWKDRIYIASANPDDGKQMILCLSTKDGKTIWKRDFDFVEFRKHAENSFASATPAVDDNGIYMALDSLEHYMVLALDHDGKEIWRQDLGQSRSQHGHGASPIVVGDDCHVSSRQTYAFSTTTAVPYARTSVIPAAISLAS